jgi:hypothetical protein
MSKNNQYDFISNTTQRREGGGRRKEWSDLETYIIDKVRKSWECGAPLTPEQLQYAVMKHVKQENNKDAINLFLHGKRNTFQKFIQRVLKRNNFSVRRISISQSVPVDWRRKAEENTMRIRERFQTEKVDIVINADETFLLFHPFGERLVAPTGVKRVGTVVQADNEKWGATVMIACEYKTSSILPPMIIFTGVYGAKLMSQWAHYDRAKVIFNESHWMTSNAAIIYISYLTSMFPGKRIGLIWDKHTSHYSDEVMEFVERCNQDTTTTHIALELVDEGLTPIIQVPDVAINKVFKSAVKKRYHQHRAKLPVTMGKKLSISREQLVEFVLEAIDEINEQNNEHQYISDAFKKCGLNPWSKDNSMKAFKEHLDSLESNEILRAMLANQTALTIQD